MINNQLSKYIFYFLFHIDSFNKFNYRGDYGALKIKNAMKLIDKYTFLTFKIITTFSVFYISNIKLQLIKCDIS